MTIAQSIVGFSTDGGRPVDDFYITPPEATKALLAVEKFGPRIWEPACGDGAMSRTLEKAGYKVTSTDLHSHGYGVSGVDFLTSWDCPRYDIVTNPPFRLAQEFAEHALNVADAKVALLCRLAFLEGQKRKTFFEAHPPRHVWVFSWRVPMWRRGVVSGKGKGRMMAYAWFIWERGYRGGPMLGWL